MARDRKSRPPVIAVDGTETVEGRAMLALSAIRHGGSWLSAAELMLVDVIDEDVALACDVLSWEQGIQLIRHPPETTEFALESADLYVAVAFRSGRHLRLELADSLGVPTVLAIQFPEPDWIAPATVLRQRAAFDPRQLAAVLDQIVESWR